MVKNLFVMRNYTRWIEHGVVNCGINFMLLTETNLVDIDLGICSTKMSSNWEMVMNT